MESAPTQPELPAAIRRHVVDFTAAALAEFVDGQIPSRLRQVKNFTPARRATAGALPILAVLAADRGFRLQVARFVRIRYPELSEAVDQPIAEPAPAPELVALAYLSETPGWEELLDQAREQARTKAEQQQEIQARVQLDDLALALREQQIQAATEIQDLGQQLATVTAELTTLRREIRRHRADADRARAAARTAESELRAIQAQAEHVHRQADEAVTAMQDELIGVKGDLMLARQADRTSRAAVASRARLLLDTLLAAGAGLRDELGLPAVEVRPADVIGTDPELRVGAERAQAAADPARLTELLALPQAHLIVDGYNVTIGAWGELSLAQQRSRLVTGLSALHARTRVEITCCFDGAELSGRVAPPAARGVRVRFSDSGTTADELIARLVRAEPQGRVVVVISTDREVAQSTRRAQAWSLPSLALLGLLEPGTR